MISYRSADILDRFKDRPLKIGDRVVVKPEALEQIQHQPLFNDYVKNKNVGTIIELRDENDSMNLKLWAVKWDKRVSKDNITLWEEKDLKRVFL